MQQTSVEVLITLVHTLAENKVIGSSVQVGEHRQRDDLADLIRERKVKSSLKSLLKQNELLVSSVLMT